jgi:hypothetical protein
MRNDLTIYDQMADQWWSDEVSRTRAQTSPTVLIHLWSFAIGPWPENP